MQKMVLQKWCWSGATKDVVEVVLQKMFLQRITCAFVASKCTSTFFFSLSFFHSCPFAKKTIINVALVFIFCCSYKIRAKDDNECNVRCHLLLLLQNQGRRQQRTCPIIFNFFLALQKTMTTLPIHCHLLQLKKKTKKPKRGRWAFWLVIVLCNPRKKPWCWFFLGCRRQWPASRLVIVF